MFLKSYIKRFSSQINNQLKQTQLTKINYNDLLKSPQEINISNFIESSVGLKGQGMLIIKNLPNLEKIRKTQFKNLYNVNNLPKEEQNKLKTKDASVGWTNQVYASVDGVIPNETNSFMARYPSDINKVDLKSPEFDIIWPPNNFKQDFLEFNNEVRILFNNLIKHIDHYLSKNIKNYKNELYNDFYNTYNHLYRGIIYSPMKKSHNFWDIWHTDVSLMTFVTHILQ